MEENLTNYIESLVEIQKAYCEHDAFDPNTMLDLIEITEYLRNLNRNKNEKIQDMVG